MSSRTARSDDARRTSAAAVGVFYALGAGREQGEAAACGARAAVAGSRRRWAEKVVAGGFECLPEERVPEPGNLPDHAEFHFVFFVRYPAASGEDESDDGEQDVELQPSGA